MTAIQRIGIGFFICCTQLLAHPAVADSAAAPSVTPTSAGEKEAQANRISRAFMNCLMQIDQNSEQFSKNPKVIESEQKSAKFFCEQRKADCRQKIDSDDCEAFLEDYDSGAF